MNILKRIVLFALAFSALPAYADWSAEDEYACSDNVAGKFKYYALALSWSPEFCRSHPGLRDEPQCRENRRFIVHGLWPQCENDAPRDCQDGGRPDRVDKRRIHAFMPSDYLIRHEWKAHGTCTALSRSGYFELTEALYRKLNLPGLAETAEAEEIERLFMEKNPGLDDDEIVLSCGANGQRSSAQTLDEVIVCFDRDTHAFTRCESIRDTCRTQKTVTITGAR
ncbi:ribonuclease T2 family protein [Methylocaldum gracile]